MIYPMLLVPMGKMAVTGIWASDQKTRLEPCGTFRLVAWSRGVVTWNMRSNTRRIRTVLREIAKETVKTSQEQWKESRTFYSGR